tara:strand:- start:9438 stop:9818 length:381 start_codon:yes stop_codon:yes gene_type:complete
MTWEDIIRKGMIKGHKDYKMYFSFFDGEALPFGSVVEYTGSRVNNYLPVIPDWESRSRQAYLEKGNRYTINGARYHPTYKDYGLLAESDNGRIMLPRRLMMEEGRNFKVISRGSEEQRNISVPRKK